MSIARTASWLVAGRIMTAATAILITPILARKLVESDFGLYKQIDLAATLMAPFLIFGLDKSITYFVPRKGRDPAVEITTPILAILTASLLLLVVALVWPQFFAKVLATDDWPLLVTTAALYGIASALSIVISRALIAAGSPGAAAVIPPIVGVPRSMVLLAIVIFIPSLTNVLYATMIFAGIQIVAWVGVLVKKRLLVPPPRWEVLVRNVRYSSILALASLAQTWGNRIDRYLVSSTLSPAMFAVFSNGKTRVPFIPIFTHALRDATAPRYSKLESEGRYLDIAMLWRTSAEALLPVGILVACCLALTAQWSIPLYYGPKYVDSVPIFQVFAFSVIMQSMVGEEQILRALSALKFLFVAIVVELGIRIGLGLLTLKYGSLVDLVGVQLLITVVGFLVRMSYVRHRLGVSWKVLAPTRAFTLTIPLAVVGAGATWGIDRLLGHLPLVALLTAVLVWGLLLMLALWRMGTLNRFSTKLLPARFRRGRSD